MPAPSTVYLIGPLPYSEDFEARKVIFARALTLLNRAVGPWCTVSEQASILIKPNWVLDDATLKPGTESALVTSPALLRALAEHCAASLDVVGGGQLVLGDSPLQSCDFSSILRHARAAELRDHLRKTFPSVSCPIDDWRLTSMGNQARGRIESPYSPLNKTERTASEGEYVLVDRKDESYLVDTDEWARRYRVTCYPPSDLAARHRAGRHQYLLTRRLFEANVFVNVAKLKTHIKTGITGALKNAVGLNGSKEFLPHHLMGAHGDGGDCYSRRSLLNSLYEHISDRYWERESATWSPLRRRVFLSLATLCTRLASLFGASAYPSGSWSGNDTLWRTILDLNEIVAGRSAHGMTSLNIVDAYMCGEGDGPLIPEPKFLGYLVAGKNPATVDAALCTLCGIDPMRVPTVERALRDVRSSYSVQNVAAIDAVCISYDESRREMALSGLPRTDFKLPSGWRRCRPAVPVNPRTGADDTAQPNGAAADGDSVCEARL